jgi:hypothetical protein
VPTHGGSFVETTRTRPDGTLVVGRDEDPDLLELANVWRHRSWHIAMSTMLMIDLLP